MWLVFGSFVLMIHVFYLSAHNVAWASRLSHKLDPNLVMALGQFGSLSLLTVKWTQFDRNILTKSLLIKHGRPSKPCLISWRVSLRVINKCRDCCFFNIKMFIFLTATLKGCRKKEGLKWWHFFHVLTCSILYFSIVSIYS